MISASPSVLWGGWGGRGGGGALGRLLQTRHGNCCLMYRTHLTPSKVSDSEHRHDKAHTVKARDRCRKTPCPMFRSWVQGKALDTKVWVICLESLGALHTLLNSGALFTCAHACTCMWLRCTCMPHHVARCASIPFQDEFAHCSVLF